LRICLIDDDVLVLDALALGLRESGYEVFTAAGAAAGLDIVINGGIDAIVTDMKMPGVSGAQFIAEARARWLHLPIIAISGETEIDGRSVIDTARAMGADAMLSKPFRIDDLRRALTDALRARVDARRC
jgi:DNA-binding response OmpR family regulator